MILIAGFLCPVSVFLVFVDIVRRFSIKKIITGMFYWGRLQSHRDRVDDDILKK